MSFEIVYVNTYATYKNFPGRKDCFQTIKTKKQNGKVLFNSRWRKIISKNNLECVVVDGLEFSVAPSY